MKDIDGYVTKDELYRLISRIKYRPDIVVDHTTCNIIIEAIYAMPKADVQPIKHGRWIPQGNDMWLCSNCKENIIYSMSESDRTEKQRYCCRCGTRMDLKDGDAE